MVLCVKVRKQDAEQARQFMIANGVFLPGFVYGKDAEFIYFPVKPGFEIPDTELVERDLQPDEKMPSWREAAHEHLTEEQHDAGRFAYDTVGSIAIIEIVEELLGKEKQLAELLIKTNPSIKTVLKKVGGHEGEFRVQKMAYLAGDDTRETTVKENGCSFLVDVEKVYYSVRLGTERTRISKLIAPGEVILCMFSGVAPYPIVLAKNSGAKELAGVEINPDACRYAEKNVALNKTPNVKLFCGDARDIVPRLVAAGARFDRITMPLPHTGVEFLPIALDATKPGGTIHYYTFIDKDDVKAEEQRILELVAKEGKKGSILCSTLCGQHSPRRFRVCVDIKIE